MTGHYTQDEVLQLVAYAADRGVRVVPEFDIVSFSTTYQSFHYFVNILTQPGMKMWGV